MQAAFKQLSKRKLLPVAHPSLLLRDWLTSYIVFLFKTAARLEVLCTGYILTSIQQV